METVVAIEIIPVVEDNYYKTIVYDLEVDDSGRQIKLVRDIYHSDSLAIAIELLHEFSIEGAFGR